MAVASHLKTRSSCQNVFAEWGGTVPLSPRVTIAMPVYNGAEFLRPAVESILAQSFADFELILSDDGSEDDSRKIIDDYARRDPRVIVSHAKHGGIAVATNRALQIARGEYFAPMDQDDIALPERLSREVEFLDQNPAVAVVGAGANTIDASGRHLKTMRPPLEPRAVAEAMHERCAVLHPSSMMRTEVARAVGGYRAFLPYAQDYDLFIRILEQYQLANVPDVLLLKRQHGGQVTGVASRRPGQVVTGAIVYMSHLSREQWGLDIFRNNERLVDSAARFIDAYLAENPHLSPRVLHHFSRFMRYAPLGSTEPRRIAHPHLHYLRASLEHGGPRQALRTLWYFASYFAHARLRREGILPATYHAES